MPRSLLLATLALVLPFAAAAQPVPPSPAAPSAPGLLVEPADVRQCLCLERGMATLNQEVAARGRTYEDGMRELQQLDADLDRRRQSLNTENAAEVDAFRQMFDRRQALFVRVNNELIGDYQATVERYNRAVAGFNQFCSGKSYYPPTVAAVQQNLSCPAIP
jgi:hypothetical protein